MKHRLEAIPPAGHEKDELLANMGHELRNPLSSILAFSETLHDGVYGPLNEAQKGALLAIKDCVEKQMGLITDMVDLSRLEAGPLSLSLAACHLDEQAGRALAMVRELARGRSIQIASDIHPQGGTVMADAQRLRQMMAHLMIAGILSAPVGGEVRLRISTGTGLLIQVASSASGAAVSLPDEPWENEGPASPAWMRVRALRPIGVTLLQQIVNRHDGSFAVREAAGGGVCLSVSLPLNVVPPPAEPPPAVAEEPEDVEGDASAPLILLVDDQAVLLAITSDYLQHKGFRVRTAADGREALALAEALQPDLVIMDVQMPGMDGLEAIGHIRKSANPVVAAVPVLSLSGLGGPGDRELCLEAGANSYLAKPFGITQLEAVIAGMVRRP